MLQKWLTWMSSRMLHVRFLFASPPCIPDLLMEKDFKASVLHVSKLSIALPWIPKNSPQSWNALVIKLLTKNTKTYTIWLKMIASVPNMLIGLKCDNYYSKVFKRVIYKLWNSTFWVVIRPLWPGFLGMIFHMLLAFHINLINSNCCIHHTYGNFFY